MAASAQEHEAPIANIKKRRLILREHFENCTGMNTGPNTHGLLDLLGENATHPIGPS